MGADEGMRTTSIEDKNQQDKKTKKKEPKQEKQSKSA